MFSIGPLCPAQLFPASTYTMLIGTYSARATIARISPIFTRPFLFRIICQSLPSAAGRRSLFPLYGFNILRWVYVKRAFRAVFRLTGERIARQMYL